ncbi:MAG: hypothetical protein SPI94_04785 [Candidatus Onthovivens sp.]|nr:hypothetical protein [Candidatus Onthovivens sp.]
MKKATKRTLGIILLIIYITFKFLQKYKDIITFILILAGFLYMLIFGILHNTVYGDGLSLVQLIKNGHII